MSNDKVFVYEQGGNFYIPLTSGQFLHWSSGWGWKVCKTARPIESMLNEITAEEFEFETGVNLQQSYNEWKQGGKAPQVHFPGDVLKM